MKSPSYLVMAGLDPAIYAKLVQRPQFRVDARVKPGHDGKKVIGPKWIVL